MEAMASLFSPRWLPVALCLALAGCQAYRARHNGLQPVPAKKRHEPSKKVRTLRAEVITNPDGSVANVRVVRPSGSTAMDDFVLESIRSTWPPASSQRTVVEVSHSPAAGFSEPTVISTAPVP